MPWSFETSLPPQSNVPEVVNDTQDFYRKPPFATSTYLFGSLGQHPLSKPPQSRYSVKTQPLTPFNSNGPQEPDMQSPMQKFNDIVDFNTPSQPPIETAPEEQSLTTQIIPEPVVDQPEEMIEQPEASPELTAEAVVQPVEPAPQRQRRRPISRSQPPSAPSDPAKGGPWASMIGKSKSNGGFMRIKRGADKKDAGRKRQSNDMRRGGPRGRLYKGGSRV